MTCGPNRLCLFKKTEASSQCSTQSYAWLVPSQDVLCGSGHVDLVRQKHRQVEMTSAFFCIKHSSFQNHWRQKKGMVQDVHIFPFCLVKRVTWILMTTLLSLEMFVNIARNMSSPVAQWGSTLETMKVQKRMKFAMSRQCSMVRWQDQYRTPSVAI